MRRNSGAKRCPAHGMVRGFCTVPTCEHYDGDEPRKRRSVRACAGCGARSDNPGFRLCSLCVARAAEGLHA